MKCDLHVHTLHSGMCTVPGLSRICFESYNQPAVLYETAKARGMNVVTVTDHDSIDAAEELRRYPDFFLSEEVSCVLPSGTAVHVGVYGITERDHIQLQSRRTDIQSFLAYADETGLFLTVNHIYSSLTGRRDDSDFELFSREFDGIETRNGQMLPMANQMAADFAVRFGKVPVGGSDSHSLQGVGRTWTDVPAARNVPEFLAGLHSGRTIAMGEHGNWWKLTSTVTEIGLSLMKSKPWARYFLPLLALAPVATLGNYVREVAFARYWQGKERLQGTAAVPVPYLGDPA